MSRPFHRSDSAGHDVAVAAAVVAAVADAVGGAEAIDVAEMSPHPPVQIEQFEDWLSSNH